MDIEELLSGDVAHQSTAVKDAVVGDSSPQETHGGDERERLAAIISGGQSQRYLGKNITLKQLDEMSDEEMMKLYARYEAKLGAELIEPLKEYSRRAYAWVASQVLERVSTSVYGTSTLELNKSNLVSDLEKNQSIDHAITKLCCTAHHKYGMYLAPLMVLLTTAMNVDGKPHELNTNSTAT